MTSGVHVMALARRLIALAHVLTILAFCYAVPAHLLDATWPVHARNHVLQALFWVVGLNGIGLVILYGPFRRGERWAWRALLLIAAFLYGGYFLANAMTGGGAPGPTDDVFFAAVAAVYLLGLALAHKASQTSPGSAA